MSARKLALIAAIETLTASIAAQQSKLAGLESTLEQFDAIEGVGVGSSIVFLVGRAETRREVTGVVKAVKVEVTGEGEAAVEKRLFKAEYTETGDAFDAATAVVSESQIIRVV